MMRPLLALLLLTATLRADVVPVQSGGAIGSNAYVGGRIYMWSAPVNYTNCCAGGTLTNMSSMVVPGNGLTNSGDSLTFTATGRFSTTGQSKRIVITYGSVDLLDTGLQAVSNGTWIAQGNIVRLGTSQYFSANLTWDRAVMGGMTNNSGWITQTNGISTILKVQGGANVVSSITNECLIVDWQPGPR